MKTLASILISMILGLSTQLGVASKLVTNLPTATVQASTTINTAMETMEPDTIQLQLANLKCCNLAYNKILDFNTYSNDTILSPQESENVDTYNTFIETLEANGMNYSDIINYLQPNNYNK